MEKFDVNKIVAYLKPLKNEWSNLFKWENKLDVMRQKRLGDIDKQSSKAEEYIAVKNMLSEKLQEITAKKTYAKNKSFQDICEWIVKEWGGIHSGEINNLFELADAFVKGEKPKFKRIASSSKIGSFIYPKKYIIYDSRVSYSMNWILFSQNASKIFFPIPEGKNTKMNAFDICTLIRLKRTDVYQAQYEEQKKADRKKDSTILEADKKVFVSENDAYTELNNLVCEVNRQLFADDKAKKNCPIYTEMLLFSIADNIVFEDILKFQTA